MIARLYSNENFPLPVVEALREQGHDVLTTHDARKSNEGIPDHEGIIVCTDNPDFTALATKIHAQLQRMESLQGQLVRVNRGA